MQQNKLVHAVIWPSAKGAAISLIDTDGVVLGQFPVTEPVRGSELARKVPPGFSIETEGCSIVSMVGKIEVMTVGEFDTAVVTERAEISFEERMQRLERRERRHAKAVQRLEEENLRLREEREAVIEEPQEEAEGEEPEMPAEEAAETRPERRKARKETEGSDDA